MAVAGTIAAVVAALAALVTIIYARRTVLDGRDAHRELMDAQAKSRSDFTAAHDEEMTARQRALSSEIAIQRLVQAARITDVLIAIARTAWDEALQTPAPAANSQRATFIPTLQAHLRVALALFYALGGPALAIADELADKAYSLTTLPADMLQLAQNSLGELKHLTDQDEHLKRS